MNEGVILYLLNMNRVRRLKDTEDRAIDYVFKLLDVPWWCYAIATLLGRDCLAGVEEAELGVAGRVCIPHPCRNGSDPEAVCRRTHKARTPLVVETMEDPEESDSHKCDYVCTGWGLNWSPVEMERNACRGLIECGN